MGMVRPAVDLQLLLHFPPEGVLRHHALHRELDHALGVRREHPLERNVLLAAHVARVPEIGLPSGLVPGQLNLLCIDDHYIVATIHMGCKIRFVLAPEHTRYFGSKAAQSLTIGIDQYPFFGHGLFVGRNRFVAQCIHYLYI